MELHRRHGFSEEAVWRDISTVRRREYVEAVRTGHPRELAESQGFHWSAAFANSLALYMDRAQAASWIALKEGVAVHPVSGARHAGRERGGASARSTF